MNKAAKIIGGGLLLGTLCPDLSKSTSFTQVLNSDSYKVVSDNFGNKIAIALCAITVLGGTAYCVYKYLTKSKANAHELQEMSPQELLQRMEEQELVWEVSSISTQTATQTYEELKCGITNQLMVQPVSLACGHEFSRKAILEWLTINENCPKCREAAKKNDLRVSLVTTKTIQRFKKKMIKKGEEWARTRISLDFGREIEFERAN